MKVLFLSCLLYFGIEVRLKQLEYKRCSNSKIVMSYQHSQNYIVFRIFSVFQGFLFHFFGELSVFFELEHLATLDVTYALNMIKLVSTTSVGLKCETRNSCFAYNTDVCFVGCLYPMLSLVTYGPKVFRQNFCSFLGHLKLLSVSQKLWVRCRILYSFQI